MSIECRQRGGRIRVELLAFGWLLAIAAVRPAPAADDATLSLGLATFVDGVVAFNQGDYKTARERFENTVFLRPKDGTARFWLGATYLKLQRDGEALEQLRASLKAPSTPRVDLEAFLRSLPEEDKSRLQGKAWSDLSRRFEKLSRVRAARLETRRHAAPGLDAGFLARGDFKRWAGRIGLTLGADSNPHLLGDDLILPTTTGRAVSGLDSDSVTVLNLGFDVYPLHHPSGWTLGLKLEGAQTLQQDFGELDTGRLRGIVQLAYGRDSAGYVTGPLGTARVPFGNRFYSLLVQASVERVTLDGGSYLDVATGAASLTLRESPITATRIDLSFEDRDYARIPLLPLAEERSGETVLLTVGQRFFFGRRDRYLRLAAFTGSTDAGLAFDADRRGALAEAALPLRWGLRLLLGGSTHMDEYDDPTSNLLASSGTHAEPRDDTTLLATAALEWAFGKRFRLVARASHVDRESNVELGPGQAELGYRRTVTSLGLHWSLR